MTLAVEAGSLRRYQGKWRSLTPEVRRCREDKGWSFTKGLNIVSQRQRACIGKLAHSDYNWPGGTISAPYLTLYSWLHTCTVWGAEWQPANVGKDNLGQRRETEAAPIKVLMLIPPELKGGTGDVLN